MFVNNKYLTWYINIIVYAQARALPLSGYSERHHIIPKSLGGTDDKSNIVRLTGKEHFLAHKLLTKFTSGSSYHKMMHALWRMIGRQDKRDRHKVTSTEYERIKTLNAQAMSEARLGKWTEAQAKAAAMRRGSPAHNKGKPMSAEGKINLTNARAERTARLPKGQRLNLTPEQKARRKEILSQYTVKGRSTPKFKYTLQHKLTLEKVETIHLKKWQKSQGINDRQFYNGNSGWVILEKYSLKTGERLV